jgi:hypothetical protein
MNKIIIITKIITNISIKLRDMIVSIIQFAGNTKSRLKSGVSDDFISLDQVRPLVVIELVVNPRFDFPLTILFDNESEMQDDKNNLANE